MMHQRLSPLSINANTFIRLLLILQLPNNKKREAFSALNFILKHRHGDKVPVSVKGGGGVGGGMGLAEKEVSQWAKMSG